MQKKNDKSESTNLASFYRGEAVNIGTQSNSSMVFINIVVGGYQPETWTEIDADSANFLGHRLIDPVGDAQIFREIIWSLSNFFLVMISKYRG